MPSHNDDQQLEVSVVVNCGVAAAMNTALQGVWDAATSIWQNGNGINYSGDVLAHSQAERSGQRPFVPVGRRGGFYNKESSFELKKQITVSNALNGDTTNFRHWRLGTTPKICKRAAILHPVTNIHRQFDDDCL